MDDEELLGLEAEITHDQDVIAEMERALAQKVQRLIAEYRRRRGDGTVHEFRPRPGGEPGE